LAKLNNTFKLKYKVSNYPIHVHVDPVGISETPAENGENPEKEKRTGRSDSSFLAGKQQSQRQHLKIK